MDRVHRSKAPMDMRLGYWDKLDTRHQDIQRVDNHWARRAYWSAALRDRSRYQLHPHYQPGQSYLQAQPANHYLGKRYLANYCLGS